MSLGRPQLALVLTLLTTFVVALLPIDFRLGWSREISELVRFPLRPFTHAGVAIASYLRPPPAVGTGLPEHARVLVEELQLEVDLALALYHNEHLRVLDLEEQLRQVKMIPEDVLGNATSNLIAHVTSRSSAATQGIVDLKLKSALKHAIPPGTIAVYGGVHLLGRVIGQPTNAMCQLRPLAREETGFVRARVVPKDTPGLPMDEAALIHLEPLKSSKFKAEADQNEIIEVGDLVRLEDRSWPRTAQAMVIGVVESVAVNDREPLRNTIIVRPNYQLREVAYVTLIVDDMQTPPADLGALGP